MDEEPPGVDKWSHGCCYAMLPVRICVHWKLVQDYDIDTKVYVHENNPRVIGTQCCKWGGSRVYVWRPGFNNQENKPFVWHSNARQMTRFDFLLVTSDMLTRTLNNNNSTNIILEK